ncbi:E3 ubiquitin-protein ligase Midline-1-like [Saccostrea cucullata]|uniref:E3 ubiquitin-protein ligase Midline-1-like n=1 Tax=Saccostrea cuccullata TaxID=36930 RepID=UPI002ED42F4B
MASSLFSDSRRDSLLLCPLCDEGLKNPSTLPCSHIFCESCIKSYVTGFSQNGKLPNIEVPCPVCREAIPLIDDILSPTPLSQRSKQYSSSYNDLLNSSQTQTIAKLSPRSSTGLPASQSARSIVHQPKLQISERPFSSFLDKTFQVRFCEPCQGKGESLKAASHWCVNCQEGLCAFCIDQHKSMKLLKDHEIVDIFSLKPEHVFDEESTTTCSFHSEKELDLFCVDHACLVCVTCVALDHRKCRNVKHVDEVEVEKDLGINLNNLLDEVEECAQYADSVIQFKGENKKKLMKEKRQATEKVAAKVKEFKMALDTLETKAVQQIEKVHQGEMDLLDEQIARYRKMMNSLIDRKEKLDSSIKRNIKGHILFHAPAAAELKTCTEREFVSDKNANKQRSYNYTFSPDFEEKALAGKVVGHLTAHDNKIKVADPPKHKSLSDSAVEKLSQFSGSISSDQKVCNFTGAVYMENGNIVLADNENGSLKLFSQDGKFKHSLSCGDVKFDAPWDMTSIDGDHIAVTFPHRKKVRIYRVRESIAPVRYFETYGACRGIAFHKDGFIVTFSEMGKFKAAIKFIDKRGKISKILHGDKTGINKLKGPYYISSRPDEKGRFFVTDIRQHMLLVVNPDQTMELVLQDEVNLKGAAGVEVDIDGNVYICSNGASLVVRLVEKLTKQQTIIEKVKYPVKLCFNPRLRNIFFITNQSIDACDNVLIYNQC